MGKYIGQKASALTYCLCSTSENVCKSIPADKFTDTFKVQPTTVLTIKEVFTDIVRDGDERIFEIYDFSGKESLDFIEIKYEVQMPDDLYATGYRSEIIYVTYNIKDLTYQVETADRLIDETTIDKAIMDILNKQKRASQL